MIKAISFLIVILAHSLCSAGQGDLIVKFKNINEADRILRSLGPVSGEDLVSDLRIQKISPQISILSSRSLLATLKMDPNVLWVQEDHPVSRRETIPNDEMFSRQWSLASNSKGGINATTAWDQGQGGKNFLGQDVVVAVVDEGVDYNNLNLAANMWQNPREIADNNIDDDNNGYIDDIYGWNGVTNTNKIRAGRHGTHVAGIIGAVGNDRTQTVGVNWMTKVMTVQALGAGGGDFTSTVLRSYGYVLKQKELFLQSGGSQGANIVATNSSFGVDYADCKTETYPAWNDIYNAMGEAGILSVAATINGALDVDSAGDVPTGCSSNYLVTVTNTNVDGLKFANAGWGKTTIDIGAPGTDILSTVLGNQVQSLTGTSMATPHVTGAIAFLYSLAGEQLREKIKADPAAAALQIKQVLLDSVTAQADLKDKTVSGGRLNLDSALKLVK